MARIKFYLLAVIALNLFMWEFAHPGPPPEGPEILSAKIAAAEKELPELEETAKWVERVEECLKDPPSGKVPELLQEIALLARERNVTLQESSALGGEPPRLQFTAVGNYPGIAALANLLETRLFVQIVKVTLRKQDDGLLEATFEALVRNGQWEGQGKERPRPEPLETAYDEQAIGEVDVFNRIQPQPDSEPPKPRVNIRYLGMYAGKNRTTVILQVEQENLVVRVGEVFSRGLKIVFADAGIARIQDAQGEEWTIPMEQPR